MIKELYLKVLKEGFLSNLLFPLSNENLLKTAIQFKSQDIVLIVLFALIGFIFSNVINYFLGFCMKLISPKVQKENDFIIKMRKFYIPIILLTSPIQYGGGIVILVYGYLRFSLTKALIMVTLSKLLFILLLAFLYY